MIYVFSDIHIGDDRSNDNLDLLFETIRKLDKKGTIVLNGDCFDLIRCEELDSRHFKFIELVNQFFNVVYITGNHDYNSQEKLKNVNFLVVNEFSLDSSGKKVKILHGQQVDFFARKWPKISKVIININAFIYRVTGIDIERSIKKNKFLKKRFFNSQVKKLINKYKKDYDCLISGHVHQLCDQQYKVVVDGVSKSFSYLNSGDWIDNCGYIIVENGKFSLIKL